MGSQTDGGEGFPCRSVEGKMAMVSASIPWLRESAWAPRRILQRRDMFAYEHVKPVICLDPLHPHLLELFSQLCAHWPKVSF